MLPVSAMSPRTARGQLVRDCYGNSRICCSARQAHRAVCLFIFMSMGSTHHFAAEELSAMETRCRKGGATVGSSVGVHYICLRSIKRSSFPPPPDEHESQLWQSLLSSRCSVGAASVAIVVIGAAVRVGVVVAKMCIEYQHVYIGMTTGRYKPSIAVGVVVGVAVRPRAAVVTRAPVVAL